MPNDPSNTGLPFDGGNEWMAISLGTSGSLYFSSVRLCALLCVSRMALHVPHLLGCLPRLLCVQVDLSFSPPGSAYHFSSEPPRLPALVTVNATLDNSFVLESGAYYNWTVIFLLKGTTLNFEWSASDPIICSLLLGTSAVHYFHLFGSSLVIVYCACRLSSRNRCSGTSRSLDSAPTHREGIGQSCE